VKRGRGDFEVAAKGGGDLCRVRFREKEGGRRSDLQSRSLSFSLLVKDDIEKKGEKRQEIRIKEKTHIHFLSRFSLLQ
jgi:hypothetical protein